MFSQRVLVRILAAQERHADDRDFKALFARKRQLGFVAAFIECVNHRYRRNRLSLHMRTENLQNPLFRM